MSTLKTRQCVISFIMAKTKYREYVDRMLEFHKKEFGEFKKVHDEYVLDEEDLQEKFNKAGEKITPIIREWENRLCRQSDKAGYGNFTSKLAEKFQSELKKHFSKMDQLGLIVETQPVFAVKRIQLS